MTDLKVFKDSADLKVFKDSELGQVRTLIIKNEPWFVGKDVTDVLGYSNSRDAMAKRVDDEDKGVAICDTPGGKQSLVIINESGLYSLILSSKLPAAKKFKRWVTSEVLPTLRKTGSYTMQTAPKEPTRTPDEYIEAARILASSGSEQAPAVAAMLTEAGFRVSTIPGLTMPTPQALPQPQPSEDGMNQIIGKKEQAHLQTVFARYSDKEASRRTGLPESLIRAYRCETRIPRQAKYQQMMKVLDK